MMMSCSRCFMILKVHSLRFLYDGVYCQEYTHMLLDFALHCILHVTTRRDPQHFHHKILWSSTGTDVRSVIRMRSAAVSISAIVMMGYMWTISICPNTTNQKKIRSLSDLQLSGSWGPWGPWQDCSRSCGGGLQKQIRVCLSVHSQQSRNRDLSVPQHRPTTAHKPTTARDHTHGWRKSNSSRIGPRPYSYSRNPYAMPFRKDSGRTSDLRQRRSDRTHFKERSYFRQTSDQSHIHHINITNTSCSGESHQHKICNNMTCPSSSTLIRQQQCSVFNTRVFMGRLYDWEPFNFSEHDCQLNCRAVGFRFYIRQSDDVIDGSSCGHMAVCLAGKCQRVGCDGVVASEQIGDRCGVCGGDGRSCKLISGLFQHSLSKVGYHKIVEIPSGASKINITERMKSTNYLALRSRSGRSIINGNWAIDSPGLYEGAGTIFTYRRPNEISSTAGESFLAEGPTNDILEVYMIYQQPNPGVHYEFLLPSENTQNSPVNLNVINGQTPSNPNVRQNPSEDRERSGVVQNNNLPASGTHAYREYNWKLMRRSDCSASCGRGVRYGVFSCVHRNTNVQVQNNLCDSSTKPDQQEFCNIRPCPAFWDIGEWSECSKLCGLGSQHRQVLCRQVLSNRTSTVHVSRCHHLERPETSSTCQLKICSEWNILSDWSPCSVPCGVGQRSRQVQCVSNVGDVAADEECNMKLRPRDVENCDAGPCTRSWFFSDWSSQCSAECGPGVRTRSVVCFNNHISSVPLESCGSERPPEVKPCNSGSCDSRTEWFTGPWSQCSAACGSGYQERAVVCLMTSHDGFTVMPSYECSSLEKPLSQQNCVIKTCTHTWYHTDWSQCSKSCDGGYRVREVRCISDHMTISDSCEEISKPHMREMCNSEPCLPLIDEKCRDMYLKCNVVVQARLCVYEYYKTVCCASCTRVAQKRHR